MGRSPGSLLFGLGLAVAATFLASGCTSAPWAADRDTAADAVTPPSQSLSGTPPGSAAPATPQAHSQAMHEVMAELEQLGALDPAAQKSLMSDLRKTDPALWPLVLQQFRAMVAWRHQNGQRDFPGLGGNPFPPAVPAGAVAAGPTPPGRLPPLNAAGAGQGPVGQIGRLPAPNDVALAPTQPPQAEYPGTPHPTVEPYVAGRPPEQARAPGPVDPVIAASYAPAAPGDWRAHLNHAVRAMESQLQDEPGSPEEVARHAQLRMLYLLAGRRDDAVRAIPSTAPATQDFWSKQLFGLATWLDTTRTPNATVRAAETKRILDEAVTRLGQSAPLVLRNLTFCTKVHSYGCVEQFKQYEFVPGQEMLLYAEVENFASESTPEGFHTSLRSSYQIFDGGGNRVCEHTFQVTEEHCRNPRRDFFIGYRLQLPERIYPGRHTLKLTIEDLKSHKVGQSSIELTVKEPQK